MDKEHQKSATDHSDKILPPAAVQMLCEKCIKNNPANAMSDDIPYKYNEKEIINEISEFINKTYSQHYAQNKIQAMQFIIDMECGEQFCLGSILKYIQRYGKKNGKNKMDLLKIIHYTIMLLYQNNQNKE